MIAIDGIGNSGENKNRQKTKQGRPAGRAGGCQAKPVSTFARHVLGEAHDEARAP
jgi:hypothetical protein